MKELDSKSNKDIHRTKGDENESDNKAKKCLNCGLELPLAQKERAKAGHQSQLSLQ